VNSIMPALAAGNTVILKHSAQTPLCAERFAEAFEKAGLPAGVFQHLHLGHAAALALVERDGIDFVAFTGSVPAGHAIQASAARHFIGVGLELGGKDPAYVRADATLEHAVANVVDGAFFNSGQSCCGIERVYVHEKVYDAFVEGVVETVGGYRLGNPLDSETTLGPLVKASAAEHVRAQIAEAKAAGARALIDPVNFPANLDGSAYLAPQVLVDVDHGMRVMTEESFGPVVGIMKVDSDERAIALMNDSDFGLTASVWTNDEDRRAHRDRHLVHEPLRLPGSRACLDRCEGFRSRLHPVAGRLRAAYPTHVISSADENMSSHLENMHGNWGFPTTVRFGGASASDASPSSPMPAVSWAWRARWW
jgi:acyl-CoA reductase-like NAD-dependent aldehyde dehydrogenase